MISEPHKENFSIDDVDDSIAWIPPSLETAEKFRADSVFQGGNASLNCSVCASADIDVGLALYFQFVKNMAICFFIMFLLSVPCLVFSYLGHRIQPWERDTTLLYQFTIGNIGSDSSVSSSFQQNSCNSKLPSMTNSTCIRIANTEVTMVQVETILTTFEFLQILTYLYAVYHLWYRANKLQEDVNKTSTTVRHYAIMVRNLPSDTSAHQLVTHFSSLYALDKPDWRRRPGVAGAKPVTLATTSQMHYHANTWVAECTLFPSIGRELRTFKEQDHLAQKLNRAQALVTMYGPNTKHADGPNPTNCLHAKQIVRSIKKEIDALAADILDYEQLAKKKTHGHRADANSTINIAEEFEKDVISACVIFEHNESFARSIEDFAAFSSFPRSIFYPEVLKFRGRRLVVKRAPEPDSVLWENLDVPHWRKLSYRSRTTVVGAATLIACFAIILEASVLKTAMESNLQYTNLCPSSIPELFNVTAAKAQTVSFTRPKSTTAAATEYDKRCAAVARGSFYAVYTYPNGDPVASYNWTACSANTATGLCPRLGAIEYCPCITTKPSREQCSTLECSTNPHSGYCVKFNATDIGQCFCLQQLSSLISARAILDASRSLKNSGTVPGVPKECNAVVSSYIQCTGMIYASSFTTVVINMVYVLIMNALTKAEAHSSVSSKDFSLAVKTFIATFFNMALVVLIAFGYYPGLNHTVVAMGLLQGPYNDFSPQWYGSVGVFLVVTFVIQVLAHMVLSLLDYFVLGPCTRLFYFGAVRRKRSRSIVTQDDLNSLIVGPVFDTSANVSQMLSLVFVAMLFAPGIPLFNFLGFVTFSGYFYLQKRLVLRYYRMPPKAGDEMIRQVVWILPFAAVLRLLFAIWMLGNPELFPDASPSSSVAVSSSSLSTAAGRASGRSIGTTTVSSSIYQRGIEASSRYANDYSGQLKASLLTRLFKPSVFPLSVLAAGVVVMIAILSLWRALPFYWIIKFVSFVKSIFYKQDDDKVAELEEDMVAAAPAEVEEAGATAVASGVRKKKRKNAPKIHTYDLYVINHPLRQASAPFTGEYFQYSRKDEIAQISTNQPCCTLTRPRSIVDPRFLSPDEVNRGWKIAEKGKHFVRKQLLSAADGSDAIRAAGSWRRTYEVVQSHGLNTYRLEHIPAYKDAMTGIRLAIAATAAKIDDLSPRPSPEPDEELGNGLKKIAFPSVDNQIVPANRVNEVAAELENAVTPFDQGRKEGVAVEGGDSLLTRKEQVAAVIDRPSEGESMHSRVAKRASSAGGKIALDQTASVAHSAAETQSTPTVAWQSVGL